MRTTVAVVAVLASALSFAAVSRQATPTPGFPVSPRNMVTINAVISLDPGATSDPLYEVPLGFSLVITDPICLSNQPDRLVLVESLGGVVTTRREFTDYLNSGYERSSGAAGLGTVFRAGSRVGLRSDGTLFPITARCAFLGYLVADN